MEIAYEFCRRCNMDRHTDVDHRHTIALLLQIYGRVVAGSNCSQLEVEKVNVMIVSKSPFVFLPYRPLELLKADFVEIPPEAHR